VADIIDFEAFRRSLKASKSADTQAWAVNDVEWLQELGFTQLIHGETHDSTYSEARNAFAYMIWDDIPLM
jgi:hypothetical protein